MYNKNSDLKIAIVNVINKYKKVSINKDLNGGFGTADTYQNTFYEKIIGFIKKKSIKLPIISLAFLLSILKEKGFQAKYYEGKFPNDKPDIILIYGSIVDYKYENKVYRQLKKANKNAKIGFIGPFPSTMPELFQNADFVIIGDFENYFLNDFKKIESLNGKVYSSGMVDMDKLPSPNLEGFPINDYSYYPAISKKPFFSLQSSKGCPYDCSYYCIYGHIQGRKMNVRSVKKVIQDIMLLQRKYNIKGFQFRDPTFGIQKNYINELCDEIIKNHIKIHWGMETRVDLLDNKKIKKMYEAGLRNINIGIETTDPAIAKKNNRLLANIKQQEQIINYCKKIGVKISAFYIFGYEGETKKSMLSTLSYAKKLNTHLARFAVCTPYPGTNYFNDLKKKNRILTYDYEKYTQFNLVIKHDTFSSKDIKKILSKAYKEYYFRFSYIKTMIQWKIKELFL